MTEIIISTTRSRVNVMIPGTGDDGSGNHYFPAARGNVREYVRQAVLSALAWEAEIFHAREHMGGTYRGNGLARPSNGYGLNLCGRHMVDDGPGTPGRFVCRPSEAVWTTTYDADGHWQTMRLGLGTFTLDDVRGDRGTYRTRLGRWQPDGRPSDVIRQP